MNRPDVNTTATGANGVLTAQNTSIGFTGRCVDIAEGAGGQGDTHSNHCDWCVTRHGVTLGR